MTAKIKENERVATLEANYINIQKDLTDIKKDLKDFITSSNDKFACKSVEDEFKDFRKLTDKRIDIVEKRYAYISGAVAVILIVLQIWKPFG